jgi:hypothetical protein
METNYPIKKPLPMPITSLVEEKPYENKINKGTKI